VTRAPRQPAFPAPQCSQPPGRGAGITMTNWPCFLWRPCSLPAPDALAFVRLVVGLGLSVAGWLAVLVGVGLGRSE
jgi:hypothetical protein